MSSGDLEKASDLGGWLSTWEKLDFDHANPDELRKLAAEYKEIGLGNKTVPSDLREAAKLIEKAEQATDERHYQSALGYDKRATAKLKSVPALLRTDVKTAERATGARLSPNADHRYTAFDNVFPVEADSEEATVLSWIDGDTVKTSQGPVRLIGVDTPEMTDGCSRAQAAKEYAQSLAPEGSTITLTNPASVDDTDKYDRLLRYVDTAPENEGTKTETRADVGYSLLLSSLAVSRYDSRDGYQWHPRERLYRMASQASVESDNCRRNAEKAAFVLAITLAKNKHSDEYWRRRILGKALKAPYESARKHLPQQVREARKADQERDRLERELSQHNNSTNNANTSGGGSGGAGADGGYTGPRCYAPGGKTWRPC